MNAYKYLKQKQIQWANRRRIALVGSQGLRGERAYTPRLEQNLFLPLSDGATIDYCHGKGGELAENEAGICKMQAVHSSAALTVNLFQYWRSTENRSLLVKALSLFPAETTQLTYERKLPIANRVDRSVFPVDPHVDAFIAFLESSVAVESKFTEAYSGYKHAGLKPAYFGIPDLWTDLPACKALAQSICPNDPEYNYLHPAQLLKHILGLKHLTKNGGEFQLLYLWCDVPFDAGYEHRREIERFSEIVKADRISFRAMTVQELILSMAEDHWQEHQNYIDYLTE
jgi:hypothetical protein